MSSPMTIDTDVLVVGAGPAGVSAALFLAKQGVRAVTITKYPGLANSPRAHITNQRTIEVFRDQGIEEALVAAATPQSMMTNVCWMKRFSDEEICRFEAWGGGHERKLDYENAGPSAMCNLPQHVLEPIVHEAAVAAGADVRFGLELVDFRQDGDGVTAEVRDRATGEASTIRAKYMIGADGGNSLVAAKLGIEHDGQTGLGAAVTAWIECDLTRYVEHRPSVLYWVVQPGGETWLGTGCYVAVRPWTEWMLLFVVGADDELALDEDEIRRQVRHHVGDPELKVALKGTGRWLVNNQIARRYRERRVFIAGDAAHRHPPANGLGSNTSIQDSYNLCWKLAAVLRGEAGEALLDTYEQERLPVGRQVVERAIKSMGNLVPVMEAIAKGGVDAAGDVDTSVLTGPGEEGERRRAELADALELQHWHFNALGVELGQAYRSDAVAADEDAAPDDYIDRELHYVPTTAPGARLPHAWLSRDQRRVSTHDITGKGRFTLLVGIDGGEWTRAAERLADELDVPLTIEPIGLGQRNADVLGAWAKVREVRDDGAILVRPDAHVAWRAHGRSESSAADLRAALLRALGRDAARAGEPRGRDDRFAGSLAG